MIRLLAFAILLMGFSVSWSESVQSEELVVTLTNENFTTVIDGNDYVFVCFYAPWCGHCKALSPEFRKAAEVMSTYESIVKFAMVDATKYDEIAYEQQAFAYPTLKFFRNNVSVEYTGGRKSKEIIDWLKKELEPPIKQLCSVSEIKAFLKANPIAIVGFFVKSNTEKANLLNEVAAEMKNFVFGAVDENAMVISDFDECPDTIVLYKPYDEARIVFDGAIDKETLKQFIQLNSLPLIIEFDHAVASKILRGSTKAFLLFFISDEGDQFHKYVEPLKDLAQIYRDHLLFITVTYDDKDKKRAFEYFGITKSATPDMRLIKIDEKDALIKYKPNNRDFSIKTVDDFIQRYIEGCLSHHYLSENLPDDWDERPVKVLVGSNFHDVAFDYLRIVLVEFYAPWCGHCKQLDPILEQLAEKYKDNDEIIIAKINGVYNEVKNLIVTAFPTIKLFLKYDNKEISYNGARTLEGLDNFIKQNCGYSCNQKKDEL